MSNKNLLSPERWYNSVLLLMVVIVVIFSSNGCNITNASEGGGVKKYTRTHSKIHKKKPVVNIGIRANGELIIRDSKGKRIPPIKDPFPVKVTSLINIRSITLAQTKGSPMRHWVRTDGQIYCVLVDTNAQGEPVVLGPCPPS